MPKLWLSIVRISPTSATLTAPLVRLRAPIEGLVTLREVERNRTIPKEQAIGGIHNPRADERRLLELRTQAASAASEISNISREIVELEQLETRFATVSQISERHRSREIASGIRRQEALLAADGARFEETRARVERVTSLVQAGVETEAALEVARRDLELARSEQQVASEDLGALRQSAVSASEGVPVIVGTAQMSSTYAKQRLDDLVFTRVQREAALREKEGEKVVLAQAIELEQARLAKETDSAIVAPEGTRLWRKSASSGQYVVRGDPLLELVDCNRSVVVASLSARGVKSVHAGSVAHLTIEDHHYEGRVVQVLGTLNDMKGDMPTPPWIPPEDRSASAEWYWVVVESAELRRNVREACEIGLPVEVEFTSSLWARLRHAL